MLPVYSSVFFHFVDAPEGFVVVSVSVGRCSCCWKSVEDHQPVSSLSRTGNGHKNNSLDILVDISKVGMFHSSMDRNEGQYGGSHHRIDTPSRGNQ